MSSSFPIWAYVYNLTYTWRNMYQLSHWLPPEPNSGTPIGSRHLTKVVDMQPNHRTCVLSFTINLYPHSTTCRFHHPCTHASLEESCNLLQTWVSLGKSEYYLSTDPIDPWCHAKQLAAMHIIRYPPPHACTTVLDLGSVWVYTTKGRSHSKGGSGLPRSHLLSFTCTLSCGNCCLWLWSWLMMGSAFGITIYHRFGSWACRRN